MFHQRSNDRIPLLRANPGKPGGAEPRSYVRQYADFLECHLHRQKAPLFYTLVEPPKNRHHLSTLAVFDSTPRDIRRLPRSPYRSGGKNHAFYKEQFGCRSGACAGRMLAEDLRNGPASGREPAADPLCQGRPAGDGGEYDQYYHDAGEGVPGRCR